MWYTGAVSVNLLLWFMPSLTAIGSDWLSARLGLVRIQSYEQMLKKVFGVIGHLLNTTVFCNKKVIVLHCFIDIRSRKDCSYLTRFAETRISNDKEVHICTFTTISLLRNKQNQYTCNNSNDYCIHK